MAVTNDQDGKNPVLRVSRVQMSQKPLPDAVGETSGQWEWCWAVPLPYRVLAAPASMMPMPAAPSQRDDFMLSLGYWACLQSFLTFSFGWTRHDKGLIAWYDSGCPTEDARFALLQKIWHDDGTLERYIEWVVSQNDRTGPMTAYAANLDTRPMRLTSEWTSRMTRLRVEARDLAASGLSPYEKHLEQGHHISGPTSRSKAELVMRTSTSGVLTSRSAIGWYDALAHLGGQAQGNQPTSVRIDVHVRPIGFLGTYRRSRVTGLWFSGPHRYHSIGN